jgi:hypothetical protein
MFICQSNLNHAEKLVINIENTMAERNVVNRKQATHTDSKSSQPAFQQPKEVQQSVESSNESITAENAISLAHSGNSPNPESILQLQRTIGNQAVLQLLREQQTSQTESAQATTPPESTTMDSETLTDEGQPTPDTVIQRWPFKKLTPLEQQQKEQRKQQKQRQKLLAKQQKQRDKAQNRLRKQQESAAATERKDLSKTVKTKMKDFGTDATAANQGLEQYAGYHQVDTEMKTKFPTVLTGRDVPGIEDLLNDWTPKKNAVNNKKTAFDTAIEQGDNDEAKTKKGELETLITTATDYKSNTIEVKRDTLKTLHDNMKSDIKTHIEGEITTATDKVNNFKTAQDVKDEVTSGKDTVKNSKSKAVQGHGGLMDKRVNKYFDAFLKQLVAQKNVLTSNLSKFAGYITSSKFVKAVAFVASIKAVNAEVTNIKGQIPADTNEAKTQTGKEVTAAKGGLTKPIDKLKWSDLRVSISDAAVKLGDKRDEAQKYYAYHMLDVETINFHIEDTIGRFKLDKPAKSPADVDVMKDHVKGHTKSKEELLGGSNPKPHRDTIMGVHKNYYEYSYVNSAGQTKNKTHKAPSLIDRLVLLYRARGMSLGKNHVAGAPVLTAFDNGFSSVPLDEGRVGRAQKVYQILFDHYADAITLYEEYNGKDNTTKPGDTDREKVAKYWERVDKAYSDVKNLKAKDKQQVKDESSKYNSKIGTRQMGKGKRVAKKIFSPLLSVGYGLISGGRKSVTADTAVGGYRTDLKTEDRADKIAEAVQEIASIWGNVDEKGEGMGGKGGRVFFGILKMVRMIIDIIGGIAGNVGFLATLGSIITSPLGATVAGGVLPGIFAAIASVSLIVGLSAVAGKAAIDLITLAWSGIGSAVSKGKGLDPRSRRNLRKNAKSSGANLAGDVLEGGLMVGGAAAGTAIGGGDFGSGFADAFSPAASYSGNVMSSSAGGASKSLAAGMGGLADMGGGGLINEGAGTGLGRIAENESEVPEDGSAGPDLDKSLEKSGGLISKIVKKARGGVDAGKGAKVARAFDRILKRGLIILLDIVGGLTMLPHLIYDIAKGIHKGYKGYREAKTNERAQKTKSTGRTRVD